MGATENFEELPDDILIQLNLACNEFESRWQAGEQPLVEDVLADLQPPQRVAWLRELLPIEIEYRRRDGLEVTAAFLSRTLS